MENAKKVSKASNAWRKFTLWFCTIILVALVVFVYFRFYFVFGEGVKSGQLNFVVKKGFVFKTYEGRMIQVGYRSSQGGTIESNEFEFSVTDKAVARELELKSGLMLDLHYKEYLGRLPWRGMSKYVVDRIEGDHKAPGTDGTPPAVEFPANGQ